MPNYVKNILSFDGDPVQVDRLFSTIQGENGPVDFDKLCPHALGTGDRVWFAHRCGFQGIYGISGGDWLSYGTRG